MTNSSMTNSSLTDSSMTNTPTTKTALILGASGKIGQHFTPALHAAGWQTRAYIRGTDMNAAAKGCDLIVNGMNPPAYHDWQGILPALTRQVIDAAKTSGATVLFPGNVYVYGAQKGPWSEDTPHAPCSRKGEVRRRIEGMYRDAAKDGVQTIILRAGDFLTPEVSDSAIDAIYLRGGYQGRAAKGKITAMGDPQVKRAHVWLPDMASVAARLADVRATLPMFCDVPMPGLTFSAADLAQEIARQSGQPQSIAQMPWWLFTVASPVWELARELREMRYLYDTPHSLSGARLAQILPDFTPTPFAQVVAEILATRRPHAAAA